METFQIDDDLNEIIKRMCEVAPPAKSKIREMITAYATKAWENGVEYGKVQVHE